MKILMLGPARSVNGGISAVVNNYYTAGLDSKIKLEYIATMEDGSKWRKLKTAVSALCQFVIKAPRYEIIHIHMASDVSIYRKMPFILLAKLYRKKLIVHQHGGNIRQFYYEDCGKLRRKLIQSTLDKADLFLVVAPYLKDIFQDIVKEDKIIFFPNAIAVPEVETKDYEGENLLFLGRLCREKGIDELLDAVKELKTEFPDLQLYLGGVWADEALKKKARECGEFVHDLGWIGAEEKEKYLQKCNLFVLPTYFEGLPMSLLEGMAHGCACVASRVGGIPQVMTDREDGLLIVPKDVSSLTNAVRELLNNSELQKRLGENARMNVEKNFEIKKNVDNLVKIYKNMVK